MSKDESAGQIHKFQIVQIFTFSYLICSILLQVTRKSRKSVATSIFPHKDKDVTTMVC